MIQDCRELYDMKSAAGIPGRIGCLMEKIFTRHSDVVIAANAFRAKLMVKMFGLKKRPFNYENIRRLAYLLKKELVRWSRSVRNSLQKRSSVSFLQQAAI